MILTKHLQERAKERLKKFDKDKILKDIQSHWKTFLYGNKYWNFFIFGHLWVYIISPKWNVITIMTDVKHDKLKIEQALTKCPQRIKQLEKIIFW